MTSSASVMNFKSEFDAFLFSPIGEDKNGIELRMLSLLARQDVDPWEEAAKMARLPLNLATASLTSLIAGASGELKSQPDPEIVASRIVGLLPRLSGIAHPLNGKLLHFGASNATLVFAGIIFAVIVLVSIYFASHVKPVPVPDNPATDISSTP